MTGPQVLEAEAIAPSPYEDTDAAHQDDVPGRDDGPPPDDAPPRPSVRGGRAGGWAPTGTARRAIGTAQAAVGAGADLVGFCEKFTRSCYGFPARYASARLAYLDSRAAGGLHPGTGADAPAGAVMFWDITTGKNAGYDHVAPVVAAGVVASTSAGPGGTVARVRISDLTKRWGMRPLGWAHIYHGTALLTQEGDWFAMATEKELRAIVREVIREELKPLPRQVWGYRNPAVNLGDRDAFALLRGLFLNLEKVLKLLSGKSQ